MADEIRDIGIFAAAGILVAVLIIAGVVAGGLRFPSLRLPSMVSDKGTLILKLTDAPVAITHLNVTIDRVEVQKVEDDVETWVLLPFVDGPTVPLDLLTLNDTVKDLSVSQISIGNYTKIRLGIVEANVTYPEGSEIAWEPVNVPSGHIDIIVHFEIKRDETTIVLIDMTADWIAISHSGNLRPVLKAEATVISDD